MNNTLVPQTTWGSHTFLGRECELAGSITGEYALVRWEQNAAPDALPVELWAHAKPVGS